MLQTLFAGHSLSSVHSPIGSQMRATQRSLGSPQSASTEQSATQIFARGSQVVPNGQTCSMATQRPWAGSQRWLASPHSMSVLQVRSESGVQPLKLRQLASWPGTELSE